MGGHSREEQMRVFTDLETTEDLQGRQLRGPGWRVSYETGPKGFGDCKGDYLPIKDSFYSRRLKETSGGSQANSRDWRDRSGTEKGSELEETTSSPCKSKSGESTLAR